jgi:hypothetical protein
VISRRNAKRQFYRRWLKANGVTPPKYFSSQKARLEWHRLNTLTMIEDISQMLKKANEQT